MNVLAVGVLDTQTRQFDSTIQWNPKTNGVTVASHMNQPEQGYKPLQDFVRGAEEVLSRTKELFPKEEGEIND